MKLRTHLLRLGRHGQRLQGVLYAARARVSSAKGVGAFAALIAAPADISAGALFIMPAGARLAFSFSTDATANQVRLTAAGPTDRTLGSPALAADQVFKTDWLAEGVAVGGESDIPGELTVYVLDQWQRPVAIATGTFA